MIRRPPRTPRSCPRFPYTTRIRSRIDVTAHIVRNAVRAKNFVSDLAGSRIDTGHFYTSRETTSLQSDFALDARNLLSAGADWQRDAVESTTAFDVTERDNTGVFTEYQGKFGAHRLQELGRASCRERGWQDE